MSADKTVFDVPLYDCCNAMTNRARSEAVVHNPAAAACGKVCQRPSSGSPFASCPVAAMGSRSTGNGWRNVLEVMPILRRTSSCINSGNGFSITSISNCCTTLYPPPE